MAKRLVMLVRNWAALMAFRISRRFRTTSVPFWIESVLRTLRSARTFGLYGSTNWAAPPRTMSS
jgi:hypothetical protein